MVPWRQQPGNHTFFCARRLSLISADVLLQIRLKGIKHDIHIIQMTINCLLKSDLIMVFNGFHNGAVLMGHHNGIFQAESKKTGPHVVDIPNTGVFQHKYLM